MLGESEIPSQVVRDLLAIAQVLRGSRKAEGASQAELNQLEAAAEAFVMSLSVEPPTRSATGSRDAWSWAERGLALLAQALCQECASARVFVAAWSARLQRGG